MLPAQLLQGPSYMVSYFCCVMYVSENVLDGRISQGQSLLTMVQTGLGAICGSLAGRLRGGTSGNARRFFGSGMSDFDPGGGSGSSGSVSAARREADPAMDV